MNGLRSAEEQFLSFLKNEKPDVVLLQEIRSEEQQLSFFLRLIPDYATFFNPSGRPGYGGTAIYYKKGCGIKDVSNSVNNSLLDSEGRTIMSDLGGINGIKLLNFYTPNGNRNEERLRYKLKFYSEVLKLVSDLENTPVILGGDLNVAHTELDLYSPKSNKNHSGFLPEERKWFSELLKLGFSDTFRLFEKEGGHYTWWHMGDPKREKNRGWRFDYFLVSKNLETRVKKAPILRDVYGSDHCPILLEIDI